MIGRQGDVVVQGPIVGHAAGSAFEGGGTAAELDIIGAGDLVLAGPVDLTGPLPDGNGGFFHIIIDGDSTQPAHHGAGARDGCGDDSIMVAGGSIQLGSVDVSGGAARRRFTAFAAACSRRTVPSMPTAPRPAGIIDLGGMRVEVAATCTRAAPISASEARAFARLRVNVLSAEVVATAGGPVILRRTAP